MTQSNDSMTPHKQRNRQTKKNNRNRLCNKQTWICITLIQGNGKSLMKFVVVSEKTLKTVKMFAKGFIQHRYCGSMFTSLVLHSFWKTIGNCYRGIYVRSSFSKPQISVYRCRLNIWLNITVQMWLTNNWKWEYIFLFIELSLNLFIFN